MLVAGLLLVVFETFQGGNDPEILMLGAAMIGSPVIWYHAPVPEGGMRGVGPVQLTRSDYQEDIILSPAPKPKVHRRDMDLRIVSKIDDSNIQFEKDKRKLERIYNA